MNEEPITAPISDNDNQPATKGELRTLETSVDTKFDALVTLMTELKQDFQTQATELRKYVQTQTTELKQEFGKQTEELQNHFEVVAENIHQDVAGANQDEITLIKDQQLPDHEKRIQALERNAGLPVSSSVNA